MKISGNIYCALLRKEIYATTESINGVDFMRKKKIEEEASAFIDELTEEEFQVFYKNSKIKERS